MVCFSLNVGSESVRNEAISIIVNEFYLYSLEYSIFWSHFESGLVSAAMTYTALIVFPSA